MTEINETATFRDLAAVSEKGRDQTRPMIAGVVCLAIATAAPFALPLSNPLTRETTHSPAVGVL